MALIYTRRRLSSSAREALYDRCRGDKAVPECNLCGLPILLNEPWDESHEGAPSALGGTESGVAHRQCNRDHGAKVVTPMVAKAKRGRQKHIGAFRTKVPMPCGRASSRSKSMNGGVKQRETLADHHRTSKKIFRRDPPDRSLSDLDVILASVNAEMVRL